MWRNNVVFCCLFTLFCCRICFVVIYAVLSQNLLCHDLGAFEWRKFELTIVPGEKWQISGMVHTLDWQKCAAKKNNFPYHDVHEIFPFLNLVLPRWEGYQFENYASDLDHFGFTFSFLRCGSISNTYTCQSVSLWHFQIFTPAPEHF